MVSCVQDNSFSGIFGGACGGPNTTKPFIVCFSWIPARFLAKLDIISGEITTHTFTYGFMVADYAMGGSSGFDFLQLARNPISTHAYKQNASVVEVNVQTQNVA